MKTTFEDNALTPVWKTVLGEAEDAANAQRVVDAWDEVWPFLIWNGPQNATCGSDEDRRASRADHHSRRSYALRRFDYATVQIVEEFLKTLSSGVSPPGGRNRNGPG